MTCETGHDGTQKRNGEHSEEPEVGEEELSVGDNSGQTVVLTSPMRWKGGWKMTTLTNVIMRML